MDGQAVADFAEFAHSRWPRLVRLAYGLTGPLAGLLADRAGYSSVFLVGACAAMAGLIIAISLRRRLSAGAAR